MLSEKGIGGRVVNSHVPVARRKLQSYDRHCKRSLYPRRPKRGLGVEGGSGFSSAVDMKKCEAEERERTLEEKITFLTRSGLGIRFPMLLK